MAEWRNRIVGEDTVDPAALKAHPHNWRLHPSFQQKVLEGILSEVGWIQRIIVNQRTGHVVDGHLRLAAALYHQESSIPVIYVDLSEHEENVMLASLDPLATLATPNISEFSTLLETINATDPAMQKFFDDLAQDFGISTPAFEPGLIPEKGLDERDPVTCPACGHKFIRG